ncbi:MAG: ABC transporter ATP-binding protein [Candidatus Hydrogenedentes bacterium]|nr:ABC transporter ATP-binding protein [Candidatus Hydrogenedentota bacterium]
MGTVIAARGLSKWFGEVVALNDINLEIESGVTGLLGANGAGKSTFIKLALGLYRPSRGSLTVFGQSPRNNLPVLRRIGYCPELDTFHDNMTGFEYVYWLNRYWGMTAAAAEKAAEQACDRVRMTDRMDDPIEEYSKGMRQRIKIAQAIAADPDLLFLDEPMAGLDPQGREEMFSLIRELGDNGYSVIVSSHILYEVERVTDHVVLLFQGSVMAHGRVREIRSLIDRHPHTIHVDCNAPRALAAHFLHDPGVLHLDFEEHRLVIKTRDPGACYARINEVALTPEIEIHRIQCADDNLQAVFDYLVK